MNTPNPSAAPIITWWYASKQQKFGPYSEAELHSLARAGEFQADDLVWNSNLDEWVVAESIRSLVFGSPVAQSAISSTPDVTSADEPLTAPTHTISSIDSVAPFETPNPTSKTIEQKQLTHFVGINHDFYLRHWEKEENLFSWNWAAFCLGLFWLAYRKMYWACAILVGFVSLLLGTALQLKIPIETVQQWQPYFVISFSMALGLFGNRLYLLHAKHKIRKITEQHTPDNTLREIEKQGGGSMMSVFHVLFAVMIFSVLLGVVFGK